jgi:asparagine synthase (glutamine-hydrolysing)
MCGISVLLDRRPSGETLDLIAAMHGTIRHRGPDGEGFVSAGATLSPANAFDQLPYDKVQPVVAAFRRLNILDMTPAASQPMISRVKPLALLFNGEIYNFRELRAELERGGRSFRSSGDTEVVLASYERWGTGCFERFEGMWAIVIIDLQKRQLVLSRDRFGIKPLFWSIDGPRLFLASEGKQIVAATKRARANRNLVGMFLRGVRSPVLEETFFDGISALPPATFSEVPIDGQGDIELIHGTRYWDLGAFDADRALPPRYEDAVDRFESLLLASVAQHRVADVRVGSLLSGGVDSSTLAVMLSEFDDEGGRQFPTFSFGFRSREADVCEMPFVDAVVKHRGLVNFETSMDVGWVRDNNARVIYTLEEPLLGIPPLAQYRVLQLAGERGTTVLFDGQGSDELFAGYPYHQRIFLSDRWHRRRFGDLTRELRAIKAKDGGSPISYFLREMAFNSLRARIRNPDPAPRWIEPSWASRHDAGYVEAMRDRGPDVSQVNQQIHFDVRWGNVKTILGFGDRNGMAHSLEVRVPFFDRELVEFAMTLPDSYKIGQGDRKRILRDVARRRLPPVVTERVDRLGFGVPHERWMRNGLWSAVRDTITASSFESLDCFRRDALRASVHAFESGENNDARAMWRLHNLALWKSTFGVTL